MEIIKGDHADIYSWATNLEPGALAQARNVAALPGVVQNVALMPDAHQGYGMPIGGVVGLEGYVCPNAVGVDIGCGMQAVQFDITADAVPVEKVKQVMGVIRELVPVGFEHRKFALAPMWEPGGPVTQREFNESLKQAGTLGGGNHFIELQRGEDGGLWAMVHSGSRNVGKQVADFYNKGAKHFAAYSGGTGIGEVNPKWDLALLPVNSEMGQAYIDEMNACLKFAKWNRTEIMNSVCAAVEEVTGAMNIWSYDIHHNYAMTIDPELPPVHQIWLHRKGATSAECGQLGIIPGSQGSKSYITRGLGSFLAWNSSSHGAGRKMGRGAATRELSLEGEIERLNALGVVHSIRNAKDLDEAPGAYKDIEEVMANQEDLVEIVHTLTPLGVIKG